MNNSKNKILTPYQEKRNIAVSHEPKGEVKESDFPLPIFVIQRHDAQNLHFDLRLEHRGVLLSWAISKKPVRNKDIKRLAVKVEDHPLDYAEFSGLIPKDNYGAGIVEIWDRGLFYVEESTTKDQINRILDEKLKKGHFSFYLQGQRMDGKFVMVRMGQSKNWLLYYDEENEHEPDKADDNNFFGFVPPMIPTLIEKPFNSKDWFFEPKLDGYRVQALADKQKVQLISRNGVDITSSYIQIASQLKELHIHAILDGEIIAVGPNGKPDFGLLHNNLAQNIYYYVFDILYYKRTSLINFSLESRKIILDDVLSEMPTVKKLVYQKESGVSFFNQLTSLGFEGVVAKRIVSKYESGRSKEWVKVKGDQALDLLVIGYIPNETGDFKSLMLAEENEDGKLIYRGNVGSGFSESDKMAIMPRLQIIGRPRNVIDLPVTIGEVFVSPALLVEIGYLEKTADGRLRHPVFKRIRDDK